MQALKAEGAHSKDLVPSLLKHWRGVHLQGTARQKRTKVGRALSVRRPAHWNGNPSTGRRRRRFLATAHGTWIVEAEITCRRCLDKEGSRASCHDDALPYPAESAVARDRITNRAPCRASCWAGRDKTYRDVGI